MYNGKQSTKTCLGSNKVHAHYFLSTKKKIFGMEGLCVRDW